jgi:hypothetical protein
MRLEARDRTLLSYMHALHCMKNRSRLIFQFHSEYPEGGFSAWCDIHEVTADFRYIK